MKVVVDYDFVLTDSDRHGNVRHYYRRRKGERKIRLYAKPGTPQFQAEYEAARAAAAAPPADQGGPRLAVPRPGTLRWLTVQYFGSTEFRRLDPRTQRTRRGILEHTCQEPIAPGVPDLFADFPLDRISPKAIRVLRDRKAEVPEGANNRVKALRRLFKWALESEFVQDNPARDVAYLHHATEGHHTWSVEELVQFEQRHPIGTKARLAFALLAYTGVRRSDVVLLGRQHMRQGWLKFVAQKSRRRKPMTIEIPVIAPLQKALDAGPCGALTFLETEQRRPFSAAGFGNWFRERCNEAGLPQCSAHGLRKAGAALAAENGATPHQLMSIFGWLSMKQAERYTAAARRKRMAGDAMGLLMRREAEE